MSVINISDRIEDKKQARLAHEMSNEIAGVLNCYLERGLEFDMALSTLVGMAFKNVDGAKNPDSFYYLVFKRLRGME